VACAAQRAASTSCEGPGRREEDSCTCRHAAAAGAHLHVLHCARHDPERLERGGEPQDAVVRVAAERWSKPHDPCATR